ncbi:MAG: DUF1732 domain-containing protein, partial [Spirochaetota bacterium]
NFISGQLEKSFFDFEETRMAEGEITRRDIEGCLDEVDNSLNIIEKKAVIMEAKIIETIRERFYQLLGDDIDEARVLSETALMLVRFNINEEIIRMKSHIGNFREIMKTSGQIGKKLDFLCQELNREINTIGSKSIIYEINQAVIDIKEALEKIREQLRNVE